MRLTFDSLNYSRTAGMFTVSGKDYLRVVGYLRGLTGIDGVEHDEDNSEYVFTFDKTVYDQKEIMETYRQAKAITKWH